MWMLSDEQKQRGQEFAHMQTGVPYRWTGIHPTGFAMTAEDREWLLWWIMKIKRHLDGETP